MEKRKVAIIVGSESDFSQCIEAAHYLKNAEESGSVEIVNPTRGRKVIVASIHRHKEYLLFDVLPELIRQGVDVIVAGAGWAAHLPGMLDAHLRYSIHMANITIIGVAFCDEETPRHTDAAVLSIGDVPGTQVVFNEEAHVGPAGMLHACKIAVEGELPAITLPDPSKKPHGTYTWEEMFQIVEVKNRK